MPGATSRFSHGDYERNDREIMIFQFSCNHLGKRVKRQNSRVFLTRETDSAEGGASEC